MVEIGKWYQCPCEQCGGAFGPLINLLPNANSRPHHMHLYYANEDAGQGWHSEHHDAHTFRPYAPTEAQIAGYIAAKLTGDIHGDD